VQSEQPAWNILLIDEDEDDCLLTRDMLHAAQGRKIEMDWAASFSEGSEKLLENCYDAVLVDYDLRPQNGIHLIRKFSENNYPAPLILYSGQAVYEIELEALQAGAAAYLSKREATPLLLERLIRYAIERKQVEVDLRESERTQRELALKLAADQSKTTAILEHLPVGVWITDKTGQITGKNEQANRIWAGDAPLLAGMDQYLEYVAWWPDREERVLPEEYPVSQVVVSGKPAGPVEFRIRRFDGTDGNVLVSAAPILDAEGTLTGVVGINLDITGQRQAEALFSKAFQVSPMALAISRASDGAVLQVNETFEELLGFSQQEVVGKTSEELNFFADPDQRKRAVQIVQEQGFLKNYEFNLITRTGEQPLVSLSAELINIKDEPHILTLFHDITAQRRAEEELRGSEERFSKAFKSSPVALVISKATDGSILEVNESFEKLSGYSAQETYGKTSVELGLYVNAADQEDLFRKIAEQGFLKNYETRINSRSGVVRNVSLTTEPITIYGEPHHLSLFFDITDQLASEAALRKANEEAQAGKRLLEALLDHVPEGIAITAGPPDFRITHISRRGLQISGREQEEMTGLPAGYHSEQWGMRLEDGETIPKAEQLPLYRASRYGEETGSIEMVFESKDHKKTPVLIKAAPIRDEQGQVIGAINCWLDITDRKQAEALAAQKVAEAEAFANEAELRRSEMDALFEQMNEGVLLCDLDGVPRKVNRRAVDAFGFDPTGMPLEKIAQLIQTTDSEGNLRHLEQQLTRRVLQGELIRNQTIRLKNAKGHSFSLSTSANPFYNRDGNIAGIIITWHDITQREEVAQALRESEERFRLARRAIEGVVYDWDPVKNIVYQNDGIHEVLGLPPEEPTPTDPIWWRRRIHPDDAETVTQQLMIALKGEASEVDYEYRIQHEDGHWIHIWDRAFLIKDEAGKPVRIVGFAVDITDRKEAETRANFLQQLGRDLNAVTLSHEAGELVVRRLGEFLEVDRCLIAVPNLQDQTIDIRYDYKRPGFHAEGPYQFEFDAGELAEFLSSEDVLVVDDAKRSRKVGHIYRSFIEPLNLRAFVVMPLARGSESNPVLTVACRGTRQWKEQEVYFLQQVARLAWLAIERAEVSERLRESEERFRVALDKAPIMVFTQDRDLRITWIYNQPPDFAADDILGKREDEILPYEDMADLLAMQREVVELGEPRQRELRVKLNEEWHNIIINAKPVFDEKGHVTGLVSAVMDVTDVRQLQAQQLENEARVQVQRWLMDHREKERMQLARTLHDKPLQDLLAVHLYLNNYAENLDETTSENLDQAHQMLDGAIEEIRSLALELRPPMLMHMGLEKAMRSYANTFRQRNPGLLVQLDLEQDQHKLSEDMRLAFYRIFQELLQNVNEHAGAGEVLVSLKFTPEEVVLVVSDDGSGFEVPDRWVELASSGHLGLVGISERLELLQGTMKIDVNEGQGTRVEVRAPLI
jgi:PAS domain S-box-containing protein